MMDVTASLIVMHHVMLLGTVFCNQKLTLLGYSIGLTCSWFSAHFNMLITLFLSRLCFYLILFKCIVNYVVSIFFNIGC